MNREAAALVTQAMDGFITISSVLGNAPVQPVVKVVIANLDWLRRAFCLSPVEVRRMLSSVFKCAQQLCWKLSGPEQRLCFDLCPVIWKAYCVVVSG